VAWCCRVRKRPRRRLKYQTIEHGTVKSMNFKRRYCCLLSACGFAVIFILLAVRRDGSYVDVGDSAKAGDGQVDYDTAELGFGSRRYISGPEMRADIDGAGSAKDRRPRLVASGEAAADSGRSARDCRMSNCFNVSMCRNGFRVHIHPEDTSAGPVSSKYSEILRALRASRYYTDDPEQACVFVLAVDTLDRDRLSAEYVSNIQAQIDSLKWWRGGVNHVVFNLYSGTWPDYNENGLGFNVGRAILAKASTSRLYYRPGFDISFPLFHKELSFRGGEPGVLTSNLMPPVRKYLLSFKGKRYLTGIGSETRNSLYHIHNGQDMILLTTCKHGKGWKNLEDKRCESDNLEYDK
jgi:Exostosin family